MDRNVRVDFVPVINFDYIETLTLKLTKQMSLAPPLIGVGDLYFTETKENITRNHTTQKHELNTPLSL